MDNLIDVRELSLEFDVRGLRVGVLDRVSFRIRPGTTVALVGESGSGKSVTAQALLGILPGNAHITHGSMLLAHEDASSPPVDLAQLAPDGPGFRALRGRRMSMIFQEPMLSLSPVHTVGDQVSEALFLHRKVDRAQGMRDTQEMLRLVGFPDPARALRMYPFELSGGLRQRAMIAMALVCRPALLIADEPTTALDVTIQAQILALIAELKARLNMAVLLITHDLGVVANLADEVVVLYRGRVMEAGAVHDIFTAPGHPYLRALLRAVPHFDMQEGERLQPVREIDHQTGPLLRAYEGWPASVPQVQLAVEGVGKTFTTRKAGWLGSRTHTVRAVDDVSFAVRHGECFGLVGESGCGKTTLSKMIMRALTPDRGRIVYNDRGREIDVAAASEADLLRFRRRVQYIFQDPMGSLSPRMTVFDILREPLVIHKVGDADYQAEMVKELMRLVGLDPRFLSRYPHSFSGGQRQRIGIARALALKPDMLLCDEPVSALDVSIQAQIMNLLKDLKAELGLTYLFISHNLAVVDYVADEIAVMCRGRIVEIAPREVLFRDPLHPYTRGLLAAVPYPDLARRLDLAAVMEGAARDPAEWRAPFAWSGDDAGVLHDVGGGHRVRARAGADLRKRAA
ncbi:MAG: ABC transporter ATP-binding protein [Betaproteobacteria bacterium]|nr:MAG: ABC transporter ATP-binding protein [Betaproteobacteria bacterium]